MHLASPLLDFTRHEAHTRLPIKITRVAALGVESSRTVPVRVIAMVPCHPRPQWWISSEAPSGLCEDVRVAPRVRYARRDDLHVAYAVIGNGPIERRIRPGVRLEPQPDARP